MPASQVSPDYFMRKEHTVMRIHKGRGAAFDIDKERQHNWWRPNRGDAERRNGPVKHLTGEELQAFAEREGLILSPRATFAVERHS